MHVNGYFELSSNRRDIWFSNMPSELTDQGKVRSDWNLALLEDVAAPLYAQLLAESAQRMGPIPAYYALWPPANLAAPWSNLAAQLYRLVDPISQPGARCKACLVINVPLLHWRMFESCTEGTCIL